MNWAEHEIELSAARDGRGVLVRDQKISRVSDDPACYIARGWSLERHGELISSFVDVCLRRGFRYALAENHPMNENRGESKNGLPYFAFGRSYWRVSGNTASWDVALDQKTTFCVDRRHEGALRRIGMKPCTSEEISQDCYEYVRKSGSVRALRIRQGKDFANVLRKVLDAITAFDSNIAGDLNDIKNDRQIDETQREALIQARIGQGRYRVALLEKWGNCCAVTGCSVNEVLRASHIHPWRLSTHEERLDADNGLPLIATLDALFDAGLISFKPTGEMVISEKLPPGQKKMLGLNSMLKLRLRLKGKQIHYMKFHLEQVFLKI